MQPEGGRLDASLRKIKLALVNFDGVYDTMNLKNLVVYPNDCAVEPLMYLRPDVSV